ncbi:MAG: DNA alkylation repair protein [Thermodesulfobacteriota bacterium]
MDLLKTTLSDIKKDLEQNADTQYRDKIGEYFSMDVKNYLGVRIPLVRKIGNKYYKNIKNLNLDRIIEFCELLLSTNIYEHKVIAFQYMYKQKKHYRKKDFKLLEGWLKTYVDDWSDCDDLCTHSLGYFVHAYPEYLPKLKKWAVSKNRWLRRASAVTLIYSIRRGQHLEEIFGIALMLLRDKDDLVQKGYGWMLKEASKQYPDQVFEFIMANKSEMPRTALRYAIEKMPLKYKKQAMK